jgi:hypothetical protein
MFGDEPTRARNRARRQRLLRLVWPGGGAIDVVHRTDWTTPRPVRLRDLRLVTSLPQATPPKAILAVDRESTGCPPGHYELRVDDSVVGSAVLAILDRLVLVERGKRLGYVAARGSPPPIWRMTWESPRLILFSRPAAKQHPTKPRATPPRKPPKGHRR